MDMMKIATQLLMSKLTGSAAGNSDMVTSVIGKLLGGSGGSGIDLGSLLGNLKDQGWFEKYDTAGR